MSSSDKRFFDETDFRRIPGSGSGTNEDCFPAKKEYLVLGRQDKPRKTR